MKMVKPNYNQYKASTPANKVLYKYQKVSGRNNPGETFKHFQYLKVQFIVSSAMTKHDVKNYLEKIYQVNYIW